MAKKLKRKTLTTDQGEGELRGPLLGSRFRVLLTQGALLLLLAFATAWLAQRSVRVENARQTSSRGHALADLLAVSVGSDVQSDDSSRILRILESASRGGDIVAGAVLDESGTVVSHTDLSKTGRQLPLSTVALHRPTTHDADLLSALFGKDQGLLFLKPIQDSAGYQGSVALLLPNAQSTSEAGTIFWFFLPAGLLLLAFIIINQATVRWAVKPSTTLITRLEEVLEESSEETEPPALKSKLTRPTIETAMAGLSELSGIREELVLRTRLLEFEKKRLETIIDQHPDGIVVTDILKKIVFLNRSAMRILGDLDARELEFDELENPHNILQVFQEVEDKGQAIFPIGNGEDQQQILLNRTTLNDVQDQHVGSIFTMRDISSQMSAQRTQIEFISQITHELKAPLNTIVTYVDGLSEEDLLSRDEKKELVNSINGEATRMGELIANLLQLSRIQFGSLSAQFSFLKISNLLNSLGQSMRLHAEDRELELDIQVPDNLPPLHGDKDLISVAISNLITNSIKYTPRGGTVKISAQEADSGVLIEVRDTGVGIPEEMQEKIFDRFVRSDQKEVQETSGSGLGLTLVQEIAKVHDGKVSVESVVGAGTRFLLWFPSKETGSQLNLKAA